MPFEFRPVADMPGLIMVTARRFSDDRGWFRETFKASDFARAGLLGPWLQDNHSASMSQDVVRGIHYQLDPKAQGKLVRCTTGRIFDVAVDLRRGSPSFGKWFGVELDADGDTMLWIPPGFGHGFSALTARAELCYKTTSEFDASLDRCIRWNDPDIAIDWPVKDPVLSAKDASAPPLADAEINFRWTGQ